MTIEQGVIPELIDDVTILVNNMATRHEVYYDTFINPMPKDVEVERINPNGTLSQVTFPNVAKLRNQVNELVDTVSGSGGIFNFSYANKKLIITNS